MVNALGALGGFVAPIVKNWIETEFHSGAAGLEFLAGTTLLGAVLIGLLRPAPAQVRAD
jgi:hypothetical protein